METKAESTELLSSTSGTCSSHQLVENSLALELQWRKSGNIQKINDKILRTSIYSVEGPNCALQLPRSDKASLNVTHPLLCLVIFQSSLNFAIELALRDTDSVSCHLITLSLG